MAFKIKPGHWEILIDFMENHKDFAVGRIDSQFGKVNYKRLWEELSLKLNSAGFGPRPVEKWQKSWIDYKCALKKKACEIKKLQEATGGGPETEKRLTQVELRVLAILGNTFYQGCGTSERGLNSSINKENNASSPNTSKVISQQRNVEIVNTYDAEIIPDDHDYQFLPTTTPPPAKKARRINPAPKCEEMYVKTIDLLGDINGTLENKLLKIDKTVEKLTSTVSASTDTNLALANSIIKIGNSIGKRLADINSSILKLVDATSAQSVNFLK